MATIFFQWIRADGKHGGHQAMYDLKCMQFILISGNFNDNFMDTIMKFITCELLTTLSLPEFRLVVVVMLSTLYVHVVGYL